MVSSSIFLSAEWRHLVMLNYEINPAVLRPLVPPSTELDLWEGKAFVSLVGFMFLDTRVMGIPIPFHRNFEEVNLRFYVQRRCIVGDLRGVVFVKEIVPKHAIAFIARTLYNENYVTMPMRNTIIQNPHGIQAKYEWQFKDKWQHLEVHCNGEPYLPLRGSHEEFITEHYYGYAAQPDGNTIEYEVKHPQWRVWKAETMQADINVEGLYGPDFAAFLEKPPISAFLAEGSPITVSRGTRIISQCKS